MPAKSAKQRRYLYSKFGSAWVHQHHFDRVAGKPKVRKGRAKK